MEQNNLIFYNKIQDVPLTTENQVDGTTSHYIFKDETMNQNNHNCIGWTIIIIELLLR